jgi:hypothetical protein
VWWIDLGDLMAKMLALIDQWRRNDAILQDTLLMIDVFQEQIQRSHTLLQARLQDGPFGGGNDAGDEIERPDAFDALLGLTVDGEGDALGAHSELQLLRLRCQGVLTDAANVFP